MTSLPQNEGYKANLHELLSWEERYGDVSPLSLVFHGVTLSTPLLILAMTLIASTAKADLQKDAMRVLDFWEATGSDTSRTTLFLEQGRQRWVKLDSFSKDCLSIAILAPRSTDVALTLSSDESPLSSLAGLLFLSRCGAARAALERFAVEMRGSRAAVEILSARGAAPAIDPRVMLPERISTRPTPPFDPGRAPSSEPLAARGARAEGRARAEGAEHVQKMTTHAQGDGHGRLLLAFQQGCHRLDLLADTGHGGRVADLDAELYDPKNKALLTRDRSDTPDARLEFCTVESTVFSVSFRGAPARASVLLVQASWSIPSTIPAIWGNKARANMAFALAHRGFPAPITAPIQAFTGLSSLTELYPTLVPGACYLLLFGIARGDARTMSLSATLDGHLLREEGRSGDNGLALAFCSKHAERLKLTVDLRGNNLFWGAALWRIGGGL